MADTYAQFDASKPIGAQVARGADLLKRGFDELYRAKASIDAVTDDGTNKDALIGGDFGALDSANATRLWEAMYTIKYVLDGAVTGGLTSALAAINKGSSV